MKILKLSIILISLILTGCPKVLLKEPIGEPLTAEDIDDAFGIYVDGEGKKYSFEKSDAPTVFKVRSIKEDGISFDLKITELTPHDVHLGWFWDEGHEAWIVVRLLPNIDEGMCLMTPDMDSLKLACEKLDIELAKQGDDTYLVKGDIPAAYWAKSGSWSLEGVRCLFEEAELKSNDPASDDN